MINLLIHAVCCQRFFTGVEMCVVQDEGEVSKLNNAKLNNVVKSFFSVFHIEMPK